MVAAEESPEALEVPLQLVDHDGVEFGEEGGIGGSSFEYGLAEVIEPVLGLGDLDLVEANEAFAAQACAVNKDMGWDPSIVNVNGGAIAIGHPIGASGARILVTLIYALRKRGLKRGVASLCLGGGEATAMAVEID